jgi:sugar phosphate isomerase/epimerase
VTLSLSEISTPTASFRDDLRAYAAAGFGGIGIWESKLDDDDDDLAALLSSGIRATNCVPLVPSILPNTVIAGPEDVGERVDALCRSLRRLAPYEPDSVVCLTGAAGWRSEDDARALVVEGLQRLASVADEVDVWLGLEPIHVSERAGLSIVTSIPEALDLLEEAGLPTVGIMVDLWHIGETPTIDRDLRENVDRISGVHVADRFAVGRDDRALPGEGVSRTAELMRLLHDAGWRGAWDVEIFGDPNHPDSLWSLDVEAAARRAHEAITRIAP